MDIGYARVSTAKQDLERQIEALVEAGVDRQRIYLDKKSGTTTTGPACAPRWPTPAPAT